MQIYMIQDLAPNDVREGVVIELPDATRLHVCWCAQGYFTRDDHADQTVTSPTHNVQALLAEVAALSSEVRR